MTALRTPSNASSLKSNSAPLIMPALSPNSGRVNSAAPSVTLTSSACTNTVCGRNQLNGENFNVSAWPLAVATDPGALLDKRNESERFSRSTGAGIGASALINTSVVGLRVKNTS